LPVLLLLSLVIPANAGIQGLQRPASVKPWVPAFAGTTACGYCLYCCCCRSSSPRRRGSRDFSVLPRWNPGFPHPRERRNVGIACTAVAVARHPRERGDPETSASCCG